MRMSYKDWNLIHWEKDGVFSKWCWYNWLSIRKKIKLVSYLTHFTKVNTGWIKYLNVKNEIIKSLERKPKILHVPSRNEETFLQRLEPQKRRGKKIFGYVKIQSFLWQKIPFKMIKDKQYVWKFVIQMTKSWQVILKIYNLPDCQQKDKWPNLKKWAEDVNRKLTR